MKKSLKIFILLILISNGIKAQSPNSFVGVRMGTALPLGEFASHNYGTGGYALLGKTLGAEAAWFFNDKWGTGIKYSYNEYKFASGYYALDYDESDNSVGNVQLHSGPYRVKSLLAGAYYKIPLPKRFSTTLKAMGGVVFAYSPMQFFSAYTLQGNLSFWKTTDRSIRPGFEVGASCEYKLYEHVSLVLEADLSYSRAKFTFDTGNNTSYTDLLQMPVFQLQPGINIHF